MNNLDHLNVDLSGIHLIEASAGTGKTFAIALLYVRILVELNLEPKQILVVTFTEAATKELRGRIRRRIREALDVVDGGETDDRLLSELCSNANGRWGDKQAVRATLDRALKSFDTASIFTIHSFCLRALQDNAFESGSRYDTELVTDPTQVMREVVDDFWRRSFFDDSAQLLGYALKNKFSPDSLRKFAAGMVGSPKLKIIPEATLEGVAAVAGECASLFNEIQNQWCKRKREIVALITDDNGLSKDARFYKPDQLPELFAGMDSFTANSNPYDLPPGFVRFTTSGIAKGTKPSGSSPTDPLFELCEALQEKVQERFTLFRGELVAYCNEQLPLRKRQNNIRFFSDLLNDLYSALCGDSGAMFAARLRTGFQAALIDEFQDTDPVQYDIFRKIYGDSDSPLFLIGDPKQAIYSFRGADIFAYIEAVGDVPEEKRFTLTSNWRSTPDLLNAFNLIFDNGRKPFIYKQIEYHPVVPGKESGKQLTSSHPVAPPLQIWLMPPEDLNMTKAYKIIPQSVAAEISRLLQEGSDGTARIGDQPVLPGDIAVIVRSHRQASAIRDTLTPLGIPCVMRSDMTIFATDEARDVSTLLRGLLNPGRETDVRGALVTDILGRSGSDIASLLDDEERWEACLEQFREYHQLWHDKGFMVMSRLLMEKEAVRGRLLRYPDGERRLTNLLHCFEVIHGESHQRNIGMEGLATWFGERVSAVEKTEEHEIRLETDEKAVKILTIHVSKGLEYPIVFCPYNWTGIITNDEVASFHDDNNVMFKDYGSDDFEQHKTMAEKEQLAESLRLLYVAVTRAKYRCYLYGGKVTSGSEKSRPGTSSIAYLFHASDETLDAEEDLVEKLAADFSALLPADLHEQMKTLAGGSEGLIHADLLHEIVPANWQPPINGGTEMAVREFEGRVRNDWRVSSFTSFASHDAKAPELPDRDESRPEQSLTRPVGDEAAAMNIFTFERGAKAGIFMHEIFEELDFSSVSESAVTEKVEEKLLLHGYDIAWSPCIAEMVMKVVNASLPSKDGSFSLADLKKGSWLPELEFLFPLKFVTSEQLRRSLKEYVADYQAVNLEAVLASLQFKPVRGIVRGFVDMVFEYGGRYYLLDWKSNHLGCEVEAYNQEAMKREMVRNLYPLQYLLYTVALNLYLSLRIRDYDYDRHFGGVFYLFLRGVDSGGGDQYGIFSDIPPSDLVNALTKELVDAGGEVNYEN